MKIRIVSIMFVVIAASVGYCATVSLDSDGTAIVDGLRTFVYGAYRNPEDGLTDFTSLASAGFNLVHDESFAVSLPADYNSSDINQWISQAQAYLVAADSSNLGVVMSLPREVILASDTGNIGFIVNSLEPQASLWFWLIMDEPTEHPNAESFMQDAYNMIKLNDTIHPVVIIESDAGLDSQPLVGNYCDIIWAKNHRVPYSQIAISREISAVKTDYSAKHVWAFCQAGDEITNIDRTGMYPDKVTVSDKTSAITSRSIRAQAHASISAGAMGLVYDIPDKAKHDIKTDTPKLWQGVVDLGAEIAELSPALLSTDSVPAYSITYTEWGQWGMPNRMRNLYGDDGEQPDDPPIGLPTISHFLRWTRSYGGRFYIGFAADYMCLNRLEMTLSFQIDQVFQHPGNSAVITVNPGSDPTINYASIPVAIWDMQEDSIIFVLNETDSLVWSISQ